MSAPKSEGAETDQRVAGGIGPKNELLGGWLDNQNTTDIKAEQARLYAIRKAYLARRFSVSDALASAVAALFWGAPR